MAAARVLLVSTFDMACALLEGLQPFCMLVAKDHTQNKHLISRTTAMRSVVSQLDTDDHRQTLHTSRVHKQVCQWTC